MKIVNDKLHPELQTRRSNKIKSHCSHIWTHPTPADTLQPPECCPCISSLLEPWHERNCESSCQLLGSVCSSGILCRSPEHSAAALPVTDHTIPVHTETQNDILPEEAAPAGDKSRDGSFQLYALKTQHEAIPHTRNTSCVNSPRSTFMDKALVRLKL